MLRQFRTIFQKQPGVGIDFGTYKSAIARKNSAADNVDIVPVIFHNEHRLSEEKFIPTRACIRINSNQQLEIHPATWYEKDEARTYYSRWFKLRLGNGWKKIKHGVHELKDERGEIRNKLNLSSERLTVEGLSGFFLNQLIKSLNHAQRENNKPEYSGRTAISVPAGWTYSQRRAVLFAAEIGFVPNPILVDEPVAAAIHLLHNSNYDIPRNENFLIIDIGAGTTDFALLFLDGDKLVIKEVDSYPIGGIQVDQEMYKKYEISAAEQGKSLLDDQSFTEYPPELHREFLLEIIREWKEKYNSNVKAGKELDNRFIDKMLTRRFLRKFEVQFMMSIEQFTQIVNEMTEWYASYVINFLEKVGAEAASIKYVAIVGGTSELYCIEDATAKAFNQFMGAKPKIVMETTEPEWCVSKGAAYYSWAVQNKNGFLKTSLEKSLGLILPDTVKLINGEPVHIADKNKPLILPTSDFILDMQTNTPIENMEIDLWQGHEENIVDRVSIWAEDKNGKCSLPIGSFFQIAYKIERDKLVHFYPPVYSNHYGIKLVLKHRVFGYEEIGKGTSEEVVRLRQEHQL